MKSKFIIFLAIVSIAATDFAGIPPETPAQHNARMEWWREAKFGMFIHWGLYSEAAGYWDGKPAPDVGEWIMTTMRIPREQYATLASKFNPVQFDADQWVETAKEAGIKYIVITSKHHEGFCMFDTKTTSYNVVEDTPWHKDPLKLLSEACRRHGVKFCAYYSIMDWHSSDQQAAQPDPEHPEYNPTSFVPGKKKAYIAYMKTQLKELITRYHPAVLWFDGEWMNGWTHQDGVALYDYLRSLDPSLIINNRVDTSRAGMGGMSTKPDAVGDFGTPEQEIPPRGFGSGEDWESCMTINDTWGYKSNDNDWKSTETLIHNLVDIASKGGNYLLNVGPTAQGIIPQPEVERLKQIGQWMEVNGQAIYGTLASPFTKQLPWGRCTMKVSGEETTLYLHVWEWPKDGKLSVGILNKVKKAYLLTASGVTLPTKNDDSGITIALPTTAPDQVDTVVVLKCIGDIQATPLAQAADGSLTLVAADAEIIGSQAKLEGEDPHVAYWNDPKDYVQWQATINQPGDFDASVDMACEPGSAGSTYKIAIGDASVQGPVESTGGWQSFKTFNLGKLHIANAGPITLTVKALNKPGEAVMNLHRIILKPI